MKKSSPESLADENKLSDKSDKFNNDSSLNALLEIENLELKNVNKIINGNINIKSLSNKFEQLKELVMKQWCPCYYRNKTKWFVPYFAVFNEKFCRTISVRSK